MLKVKRSDAVNLFLALDVATAAKWNDVRMNVMLSKLQDVMTEDTKIEDPHLKQIMESVLAAIASGDSVEVESDAPAENQTAAAETTTETTAATPPAKAPKEPKPAKAPKEPKPAKGAVQVPKTAKPGEGEAVVAKAKADAAAEASSAQETTETTTSVQEAVIKAATQPKTEKAPKAPKAPKEPKPPKEPKEPKAPKADAKPLEPWQYGAPGVRPAAKNRHYIAGQIYKKHGLHVGITDELIAEMDAIYGRSNPEQTKCDLGRAWHVLNAFVNGPDLPATSEVAQPQTTEGEAETEETASE